MLEFLGQQELLTKNLTYCHKYSIKVPEDIEEAQNVISVSVWLDFSLKQLRQQTNFTLLYFRF